MYCGATLYCSNVDCEAVFEAEGTLQAICEAICPYCCCSLGEISLAPGDCSPPFEGVENSTDELQLWVVHAPARAPVPCAERKRALTRGKPHRGEAEPQPLRRAA